MRHNHESCLQWVATQGSDRNGLCMFMPVYAHYSWNINAYPLDWEFFSNFWKVTATCLKSVSWLAKRNHAKFWENQLMKWLKYFRMYSLGAIECFLCAFLSPIVFELGGMVILSPPPHTHTHTRAKVGLRLGLRAVTPPPTRAETATCARVK